MKVVVTGLFSVRLGLANSYLVYITGASGSLGSQVFKAFKQENHDVKGLAYSRANDEFIKIDLTNEDEVVAFLETYRPDCD